MTVGASSGRCVAALERRRRDETEAFDPEQLRAPPSAI
jgi:hypothetical protein